MDNSTNVTSFQYQANYKTTVGKILLGIYVFLGIVTVLCNVLFIITYAKVERIRSIYNTLLAKLSVYDGLVGFMLVIQPIFMYLDRYDNDVCFMFGSVLSFMVGGSSSSLLAITIERYLRISHPYFSERWITKKTVAVYSVCEQFLLSVSGTVMVTLISADPESRHSVKCSMQSLLGASTLSMKPGIVIGSAIVLISSTCMYIYLSYIARKHARIINTHNNTIRTISQQQPTPDNNDKTQTHRTSTHTSRPDRKRINMIGVILAVQYIGLLPTVVVLTFEPSSIKLSEPVMEVIHGVCDIAIYSTSLWNALIYTLRSEEIKNEIMKLLKFPTPTNGSL